jgi:hypothetical protein
MPADTINDFRFLWNITHATVQGVKLKLSLLRDTLGIHA